MRKTWLVTGSNRGLGMATVQAALEAGDPEKIARVIVELTRRTVLPCHLILGSDALAAFDAAERERREQAEGWLSVSRSVDF